MAQSKELAPYPISESSRTFMAGENIINAAQKILAGVNGFNEALASNPTFWSGETAKPLIFSLNDHYSVVLGYNKRSEKNPTVNFSLFTIHLYNTQSPKFPERMIGIRTIKARSGASQFTTAVISYAENRPDGTIDLNYYDPSRTTAEDRRRLSEPRKEVVDHARRILRFLKNPTGELPTTSDTREEQ